MTAPHQRLARGVAVFLAAYAAAYGVLLALMPAGAPWRAVAADAAFLPFHPLAGWLLWLAALRDAAGGPRRWGLLWLAWGQLLGTVSTVLWVLSSAGRLPLNSVYAQSLDVVITVITVLGIGLLVPRRPTSRVAAAVPWSDITLFGLAALSVGWYAVGWPLLASGSESAAGFAWFAAIASVDAFCALLALAAWAYPSDRLGRSAAAWFALAFALTTWGDVMIELATVAGTYESGGWPDVVFVASIVALGLAGLSETRPAGRERARSPRAVSTVRALAPIVASIAVVMPVVLEVGSGSGGRAMAVPVLLVVLFVLALQWRYLLLDREVARTLTSRLGLERDLALARQFESLGRYAGSVAHDFNNLLAVISAHAELVEADAAGRAEVVAAMRSMRATVERGTTLSRRLMDLTRGHEAPAERLDLAPVVRSVSESMRDVLPAEVRLEVTVPSGEVPVVLRPGDADQLLLNLMVNARDAMPAGGRMQVRLRSEEGAAVLEVEDEGTGMDDAVRARLFEPLFTTKGARGTGLGLATVQAVVTQARGSVAVQSEVGRGTRFTVRLPQLA